MKEDVSKAIDKAETLSNEQSLPKKVRGIDNVIAGKGRIVIEAITYMTELELSQVPENITIFNSQIKNSDFISLKVVKVGKGVTDYKVGDHVQLDELLRSHYLHIDDNFNSLLNVNKAIKDADRTKVSIKDTAGRPIKNPKSLFNRSKIVEYFVVSENNILIAWDN